ncbi:MAG TPA: hypothetical protein VFO22_05840 [Candidatus Udaeobacter sp.]|nr:hypothetical protein [Candidatus Udaeobacter sp.]
MSIFNRIALTCVFLACCSPARARIGETEAQIMARYGQSIGDIPTETFGPVRGFALPGFVVGVKLVNGTSAMEMISKNDQSEIKRPEIEALLKKHGADREWKVDKFDKPDWRRWRSQDGSLVAVYDEKRHFLYVNSKQFYDEQGKELEKAGQEKNK